MGSIPVAERAESVLRIPNVQPGIGSEEKILFSFAAIERDKYFNLDGTCQNWASDLFEAMKKASTIPIKDVYSKIYSGKNSTFRIHPHIEVTKPCSRPHNAALEDMWQIRISTSKGGIHGVFVENVFYVIWFDPLHNLYPDENHGGLRRVTPPSTCCKDRDAELDRLRNENKKLTEDLKAAEELLEEKSKSYAEDDNV